jgi:hypothetical protein
LSAGEEAVTSTGPFCCKLCTTSRPSVRGPTAAYVRQDSAIGSDLPPL